MGIFLIDVGLREGNLPEQKGGNTSDRPFYQQMLVKGLFLFSPRSLKIKAA